MTALAVAALSSAPKTPVGTPALQRPVSLYSSYVSKGRPVSVRRRRARSSDSVSPASRNLRQLSSRQRRLHGSISREATGSAIPHRRALQDSALHAQPKDPPPPHRTAQAQAGRRIGWALVFPFSTTQNRIRQTSGAAAAFIAPGKIPCCGSDGWRKTAGSSNSSCRRSAE